MSLLPHLTIDLTQTLSGFVFAGLSADVPLIRREKHYDAGWRRASAQDDGFGWILSQVTGVGLRLGSRPLRGVIRVVIRPDLVYVSRGEGWNKRFATYAAQVGLSYRFARERERKSGYR